MVSPPGPRSIFIKEILELHVAKFSAIYARHQFCTKTQTHRPVFLSTENHLLDYYTDEIQDTRKPCGMTMTLNTGRINIDCRGRNN